MISMIAAIGSNHEIGYKNQLLWHIPKDMQHFKKYTTGKAVLMGRNTLDSLGRLLPNRTNIVLSSDPNLPDGGIHASSLEHVLDLSGKYDELVVIGGQSVYHQMMPHCTKLVITHVYGEFLADTHFPPIDPEVWRVNTEVTWYDGFGCCVKEYVRNESI